MGGGKAAWSGGLGKTAVQVKALKLYWSRLRDLPGIVPLATTVASTMQSDSRSKQGELSRSEVNDQTFGLARVASVDTLRGLIILLMVFVNDLGPAAPAWMHHIQPPDADGMTLADVVFPAFLFIVGISIPLAIERSLQRGKTRWQILPHIFIRTIGLLIMGLIGVNEAADITLGSPLWGVLAFVAIILAWCIVPKDPSTRRTVLWILKAIGVVGVITLLAIYRTEPVATDVLFIGHVENWVWLRTQWWGILGLIGWAYLTASILYLLMGQRREWLVGAMGMLFVAYLAFSAEGLFARVDDKAWLQPVQPVFDGLQSVVQFVGAYIDLGGATGSLAAISVAGCLLGTTLIGPQQLSDHRSRMRWAIAFALGLFAAGIVFDSFAGINKIAATPTWCLWCASLTCLVWTVVYRAMDVAGLTRWSSIVQPAGANPLIAYLLHPVLVGSISLCGLSRYLHGYTSSSNAWLVIIGSAVMSLVVCGITGLIARAGLRVRI